MTHDHEKASHADHVELSPLPVGNTVPVSHIHGRPSVDVQSAQYTRDGINSVVHTAPIGEIYHINRQFSRRIVNRTHGVDETLIGDNVGRERLMVAIKNCTKSDLSKLSDGSWRCRWDEFTMKAYIRV